MQIVDTEKVVEADGDSARVTGRLPAAPSTTDRAAQTVKHGPVAIHRHSLNSLIQH